MKEHTWKEIVYRDAIWEETMVIYKCEQCGIILETEDQYTPSGNKIYQVEMFLMLSKEEYIQKSMYDCSIVKAFIEKCRLLSDE